MFTVIYRQKFQECQNFDKHSPRPNGKKAKLDETKILEAFFNILRTFFFFEEINFVRHAKESKKSGKSLGLRAVARRKEDISDFCGLKRQGMVLKNS